MIDQVVRRSARPGGNQEARHRRQCARLYSLQQQGLTVRQIAEHVGMSERRVSTMIKIGERLAS